MASVLYSVYQTTSMGGTSFDIFQSSRGYVTISNNVQRQILGAVASSRKSFQDLVVAAGRSKPTVSLQIKDLIAQDLLEEQTDPEDGRRRYYRLKGTRIGSSDLPVQELSNAVKDYVKRASEPMVTLTLAIEGIVASDAPETHCWTQANYIGRSLSTQLELSGDDSAWMRLSKFLEKAGLVKPLRIDLAESKLECELSPTLRGPVPLLAAAIGGFADGAWSSLGKKSIKHSHKGRVLTLWQK